MRFIVCLVIIISVITVYGIHCTPWKSNTFCVS